MVNDILYHSKVLSICIHKNFRFRSPLNNCFFALLYSQKPVFMESGQVKLLDFLCINKFMQLSILTISNEEYPDILWCCHLFYFCSALGNRPTPPQNWPNFNSRSKMSSNHKTFNDHPSSLPLVFSIPYLSIRVSIANGC